VDIGIIVFRGQGILKLGAYYISQLGSSISEDVEEVGQGGNGGRGWRAIGIETWGDMITT
jgi:hypothetical protein